MQSIAQCSSFRDRVLAVVKECAYMQCVVFSLPGLKCNSQAVGSVPMLCLLLGAKSGHPEKRRQKKTSRGLNVLELFWSAEEFVMNNWVRKMPINHSRSQDKKLFTETNKNNGRFTMQQRTIAVSQQRYIKLLIRTQNLSLLTNVLNSPAIVTQSQILS